MRIPEEKIREVQEKADIVSVISKYAKLQKKGQDYVGLCLFHQDNNPSMSVSPTKKFFKCFSCGVGGNVIDFLMKYKHISFVEAVIELATEFNVDLGNVSYHAQQEKYSQQEKTLFNLNQEAMKYYQVNLNSAIGTAAKNYLTERQINAEQIKQWEIGYAAGDELVKHLVKIGYEPKQIVDAGLANQKDNGVFDYFVNRIVFPIKNQDGYIIGFSGRILGDEKPKYLNTRETLIFKKSEVLFNLNNVWQIKERLSSIILLEGFMDVISLEKIGVDNSMALMGTAFSKFHLKTILTMKKPVKLFLDGDEAGFNAMYKMAGILIKNKVDFSIIDNITNQDPDELVNAGLSNQILKMIANPDNPYEYFLKKMLAMHPNLGLNEISEISNQILELLKDESNYILVDQVLANLNKQLGISLEALNKAFNAKTVNQVQQVNQLENKVVSKPRIKPTKTKFDVGRNRIFISLLKSPDYLEKTESIIPQISANDFSYEKIFTTLINFYKTSAYAGNDLNKFFSLIKAENFGSEEVNFVKEIVENPITGFESKVPFTDKEFNDIINQFAIADVDKQINWILKTIKDLEIQKDQEHNVLEKQILQQKIKNNYAKYETFSRKKIELQKKKES